MRAANASPAAPRGLAPSADKVRAPDEPLSGIGEFPPSADAFGLPGEEANLGGRPRPTPARLSIGRARLKQGPEGRSQLPGGGRTGRRRRGHGQPLASDWRPDWRPDWRETGAEVLAPRLRSPPRGLFTSNQQRCDGPRHPSCSRPVAAHFSPHYITGIPSAALGDRCLRVVWGPRAAGRQALGSNGLPQRRGLTKWPK